MLCSLLSDPRGFTNMEDPRSMLDWHAVESYVPFQYRGAVQPKPDSRLISDAYADAHTKINVNGVTHECVQSESLTTTKCLYCKVQKVTTRAGHRVTTMFRCSVCKVPLCKRRGCFLLFHHHNQQMLSAKQQGLG
ncbi:hypothetical protein KP79_PYT18785 [Mizuhopecten yessoensis]|uniref:PiggyBac transposable element-derived protein 4 C-terminal zinc-finger domain-containing protein n=1 Tax=Mizuhopecten yessoensis TaxID=6573 RepID=A0A210Q3H6_MIZYE|nr:hypothetical protein KP79_PYT18785 [Mizuhopecten yessoensis]